MRGNWGRQERKTGTRRRVAAASVQPMPFIWTGNACHNAASAARDRHRNDTAVRRAIETLVRTPVEIAKFNLSALPGDQQRIAWLTAWTRKEALVKAMGEGLNYPLQDIEVSFTPGEWLATLRGNAVAAAERSVRSPCS